MSFERLWYGKPSAWVRIAATVALGPASIVYGAVTEVRNALFAVGVLRPTRVPDLTVVSVGNLVAGGSGKTPLTIFLAQWAQAAGHRVGVLSRGYGRKLKEPLDFDSSCLPDVRACGDEPRLIVQRVPGVQAFIGANRVASARRAQTAGCDVVLLDDGFQHRRMIRDVDIVIDVPGASGLLPLGPLRESSRAKRRAHLVVNGTGAADPQVELVVTSVRSPTGPVSLKGSLVVALSGIARPERFVQTLKRLGANVTKHWAFPDHHLFTEGELEQVTVSARDTGAVIVTTEKDAQRLPPQFPCAVVQTSLRVTAHLETLVRTLGWPAACAPVPTLEEGVL